MARSHEERCVPLEEISEMSEKQRVWLQTMAGIHEGYFDECRDEFVVKRVTRDGSISFYRGRGNSQYRWLREMSEEQHTRAE